MKKYSTIFILITFFISLFPAQKSLFSIIEKERNQAWELVRKYYENYYFYLESLPKEINQKIAKLLLQLDYPHSFNSSKQQFFSALFESYIASSFKEEEWDFPIDAELTHDGRYYVERTINADAKLYEVVKKINIEVFYDKIFYKMLKTKDALLLRKKGNVREYFLTDIPFGTCYTFGELIDIQMSQDERYIVGINSERLYLWNIVDLKNISSLELPGKFAHSFLIKFSADNKYIVLKSEQDLPLIIEITDSALRLLSEDEINGAIQSIFSEELMDYDKNYPIIKIKLPNESSFAIEVEKTENNGFSCKRIFDIATESVDIVCYRETNSLFNYLKTIFYNGKIKGGCISIGQHIFYNADFFSFLTIPRIAHVIYSKKTVSIERNRIYGAEVLSHSYKINPQETLFIAPLVHNRSMGCFNMHGERIISFDAEIAEFSLDGRSILCKNGEKNKKIVLYPEGKDKHLQKLAYSPLTVAQYSVLKEISKKSVDSKKMLLY